MRKHIAISLLPLLTSCAAQQPADLGQPLSKMCWGAGDWIAVYSFYPNRKVIVTSYSDYDMTVEDIEGTADYSDTQVTVSWAGNTEVYAYDSKSGRVFPPEGADTQGCAAVEAQ